MIAFLAAFLTPIICLLLLFIFLPKIFDGDALGWLWAFGVVPAFLGLLLTITIIVAFVTFFVARAKLPDRGWRSLQTSVIVLPFAALVLAAATTGWRYHAMTHPPEIGPQQRGLPSLHLARTLTPRGRSPQAWRLSWSADGERLATYGGAGIHTSSPDGAYQKELPFRMSSSHVLAYLSGHRLLITGPVVEVNGDESMRKSQQMAFSMAFSVIDAEAGKALQNIPGCHPGRPPGYNAASDLAVSPDERFVAVICGSLETQVDIYSPVDWTKVTTLDLRAGDKRDPLGPQGLAFSPNGKTLAVIHYNGQIRFFEVGSWTLSGSLLTYPELPPRSIVRGDVFAFSPDGAMIAVGADRGGSRWTYPNGMFGSGVLKHEFPADPLRVYRISDGSLVASLGSFPGAFHRFGLVWSPNGKYLAFQAIDDIRFWSPFQSDLSVVVARKGAGYGSLVFSRDGSQLATNFPDGVRIFDVVPAH
jgi:hypothetical protein